MFCLQVVLSNKYLILSYLEVVLSAGSDPVFVLETLPPVGGSQVRLCTLDVVEVAAQV